MTDNARTYAIHSASECARLERQAVLGGIEDHLRHIPVPECARILDAGCGSGSMARLLAAQHPDATVIGVDIREDYIAFARERACREGLLNLEFQSGNVFDLPFADAAFDLVWSKYVLQWVSEPQKAVAEFRRVVKPGGSVAACHYDGFALTHYPEDPELQSRAIRVFSGIVDPFIGRKVAPMFKAAGLINVNVELERDRLATTIGSITPELRLNWVEQFTAARSYIAKILGGEQAADTFIADYLAYLDRPDTCSYTSLYFVSGVAPVP